MVASSSSSSTASPAAARAASRSRQGAIGGDSGDRRGIRPGDRDGVAGDERFDGVAGDVLRFDGVVDGERVLPDVGDAARILLSRLAAVRWNGILGEDSGVVIVLPLLFDGVLVFWGEGDGLGGVYRAATPLYCMAAGRMRGG